MCRLECEAVFLLECEAVCRLECEAVFLLECEAVFLLCFPSTSDMHVHSLLCYYSGTIWRLYIQQN